MSDVLVEILEDELRKFIERSTLNEDGIRKDGEFYYDPQPPANDFNKVILTPLDPGADATEVIFPDGAIGVYVDGDFWGVAGLPLRFIDLPIERIVSILWPDIEDPSFSPDIYEKRNSEHEDL